jgi:catalase
MYRVGANGLSLPVNRPRAEVNTVNQDGAMNAGHTDSGVNYQPSRRQLRDEQADARYVQTPLNGSTQQARIQREQNFKQAGELFRSYGKKDQTDLINSLGQALATADEESRYIMLSFFYKADADYGTGLAKVAKADFERVRQLAAKLQD